MAITCKQCGDKFPSKTFINGKLTYLNKRSYCLSCSPLGSRNGYSLRRKNKKINDCKTCPICNKESPYNKNDICSTCRAYYQRHIKKNEAIEILGGCCSSCGLTDKDCLVFHHKDPSDKSFSLSECWHWQKWEVVKKEINKCKLLCCNCHAKLHKNETNWRLARLTEYYS